MKTLRLGEVLVSEGYITEEQLDFAIELQKNDTVGRKLGQLIIDNGLITEEQMLTALSKRLKLEYLQLKDVSIDIAAVSRIPKDVATKYCCIAVTTTDGVLKLVVNDPLNFYAVEDIKLITNQQVELAVAARDDIMHFVTYWYAEVDTRTAAILANETAGKTNVIGIEDLSDSSDDTPVVSLVNTILFKAHNEGASDIHIEPFEDKTIVRIRVDGQILEYLQLESALHNSIVARIKILSGLDIAEKRIPQDGHFRARLNNGVEINVRVSILPTVFGEKAVLRFFARDNVVDSHETFGMSRSNYEKLRAMLNTPHGIIYMTGPTGSGKTTLLYMMIEYLTRRAVNISTIEDPVERHIAKVNQTQTNNLAGLTFASGLRALLRQDPDIIMVGETRDNETASIAVSAAMTGHLVLSTLHTNDAVSTIVRLIDMGIEDYKITSSLTGAVAQRLVRKICPNCKKSYTPDTSELEVLGEYAPELYRGEGCAACNHTGYKGRVAIHEVLVIDTEIRNMINNKASLEEIKEYLSKSGTLKTLKESIVDLIKEGTTTVEELLKIMYYAE